MENFPEIIKSMIDDGRLVQVGVTRDGKKIYKPNPASPLDCMW